jgi:hypothetical protein
MSSRQQIFLTTGVLILVIIGMVMNFYTTSRANDTITEVQRLIIEGRQIGNQRGNATLGAVGEAISEIKAIEFELRDNLTAHRVVTNMTFERLDRVIAAFNNTNEVKRTEAVQEILDSINEIKQMLRNQTFDTSGSIAGIQ